MGEAGMKTCPACNSPVKRRGPLCSNCALKLMHNLTSEDPDCLICENCGAKYSASEARVQRRLKQIAATKPGESKTPTLCWVCARLYLSVQAETQEWSTQ